MIHALLWVMVNLAHPHYANNGYAYATLADCQHAMHVFQRSPSVWSCRSLSITTDASTPPSVAPEARGQRNADYNLAKLEWIIQHPQAFSKKTSP